MDDSPKWLLPAALAAAIGAAIWWLLQPDEQGATGLDKLRPKPDPYAALGAALCTGGAMYYGGAASGMGAAPLCAGVGEALAPVLKSGVDLAVTTIDAQGNIIRAVGDTGASAVRDTYGAGKTVAGDAYGGVKTVVKDAYDYTKAYVGWTSGYTPAKKIYSEIKSWF